ncbi:hypothetical protein ACFTXM_14280 [Streptomyces sp. NPDC056930]|uniref:hypothetical protein n=1 Tax=Streptomyces sp. NPDC056930 TaxID=3345967 RepID=UPI00362E1AD2
MVRPVRPRYVAALRRRRPQAGDRWHLDEASSGNARRLNLRIALVCRSTASVISRSTRCAGATDWCAASAWWTPGDAISRVFTGPTATSAEATRATSTGSGTGTAPGGRIRRARTTMRPAALLATSMTRVCSRRAFVAHADDSGEHGELAGVRVEADGRDVPGQLGSDGRPPLPQGSTGGREIPGPLGDQRADRGTEAHRLAPVAPRRTAAAVLPRRLHRGPQHDPGQVDPGHLAAAHACPQVVCPRTRWCVPERRCTWLTS